jgi:dihydrolipoamide dehydrogenase
MSVTKIAVVGAGPGGYAAAFLAADLGLDVTLIDREPNPGGVCLYRGCIPSKSLLHVAKVIGETRASAQWGVEFGEPRIRLEKLRSFKESVVERLTGGLGLLSRNRKITYLRGEARFEDSHSLAVAGVDGGGHRLSFDHIILATGSRPASLPGVPSDSPRVWSSSDALALHEIPKSLLIVGGGYIGLELGAVYAALGTEITVVEMMPGLLPGADRDLVSVLAKRLERDFASIMLNTRVTEMEEQEDGMAVGFDGANAAEERPRFEKVLLAVGRRPNSEIEGLDKTKVELDAKAFIRVDAQRRTHDTAVFAVGDVAGEPMLAHKASHEGRVAAEVIAGLRSAFEPAAVPAVVFTDPEIAWCGLTETDAGKQEREVRVARFPWAASGRAVSMGLPEGLTKLVIDPETERVLGAGIVGSGAGELISEAVLAVEMAARVEDVALSIHPHPTLSETLMEAAESFFGQSTHLHRASDKVRKR